jgi:heavy metal sensor kinase
LALGSTAILAGVLFCLGGLTTVLMIRNGLAGEVSRFLAIFSITSLMGLVIACVAMSRLAQRVLHPVWEMSSVASEIGVNRLDRRFAASHPNDELGELAAHLNGMIERLQEAFGEVHRFTADAAHELRTPLAILRNEAEVALRMPRDSEAYRESLETMLEEIAHLSSLSESLILLFREDANPGSKPREHLRLDRIIASLVEDMKVIAVEQGQEFSINANERCTILGNGEQVRRLLWNLMDNAVRFTPPPGKIQVDLSCQGDQAVVVVADTGIGISKQDLPHVFDRFHRGDSARSLHASGSGLGLPICRSIVESHHGTIAIESEPNRGTRVTITLPTTRDGLDPPTRREVSHIPEA